MTFFFLIYVALEYEKWAGEMLKLAWQNFAHPKNLKRLTIIIIYTRYFLESIIPG